MQDLDLSLLLVLATFVVTAQSTTVTWEGLIDQHCRATSSRSAPPSDTHQLLSAVGPPGPSGPPGSIGKPGMRGLPGKDALINETEIKDAFAESMHAIYYLVSGKYQNIIVMETPDDYDVATAYQACRPTPKYSEWTVFQRRVNGRVDFYRRWDDYVTGFGDRGGEFWLGLEKIHRLTKHGYHELRIDMKVKNGTRLTANYGFFKVHSSVSNYELIVGGYAGNATDALSYHNGRPFSTRDADHDVKSRTNCARKYLGAWWYKGCHFSNLNGKYTQRRSKGVRWLDMVNNDNMIMTFTEMKLREVY